MSYDPTIYSGSAPHYTFGRSPYSPQLETALTELLPLDGSGRLLDVGCGPGVLTLRLAPLFTEAIGLDPDPDMLGEARRRSVAVHREGIRWVRARAEDLPKAAPGPFRLVSFGQSFHRTSEHQVAEAVYDLLVPGGAMVMVVHTVAGRPQPPNPGYPEIPHREIMALVEQYLGSTRRSGRGYAPDRIHTFEGVLRQTRFGPPDVIFAPGLPDLVRNTESVLSGYLSMTYAAPHLFGSRLDAFCEDVRTLLTNRSTQGLFWDWPGDTEIVIARRPLG